MTSSNIIRSEKQITKYLHAKEVIFSSTQNMRHSYSAQLNGHTLYCSLQNIYNRILDIALFACL